MTLEEKTRCEIEELLIIPDPQERLAWLIGRSDESALAAEACVEENRVIGCVSSVWLHGFFEENLCRFRSHADSPMVKGLVAFLCRFFDSLSPAEILSCAFDPVERLGLIRILTPTRQNGLAAVRSRIDSYARARL